MKRVKVLAVLFVSMAAVGAALMLCALTRLMGLTAKMLNWLTKLLIDTTIAVQWTAIDLSNAARGWLERALR